MADEPSNEELWREHRRLELKGRAEPIDVRVVRLGTRDATSETIPG